MSVTLMLSQGISGLDHLTTEVTLEARMVQMEPLNMSRDVRLALRDLSADRAVPVLVLVLPHHAADASLKYSRQF